MPRRSAKSRGEPRTGPSSRPVCRGQSHSGDECHAGPLPVASLRSPRSALFAPLSFGPRFALPRPSASPSHLRLLPLLRSVPSAAGPDAGWSARWRLVRAGGARWREGATWVVAGSPASPGAALGREPQSVDRRQEADRCRCPSWRSGGSCSPSCAGVGCGRSIAPAHLSPHCLTTDPLLP
jgi:hypothetical protein